MPAFICKESDIEPLPNKAVIFKLQNKKIYGIWKKENNNVIVQKFFRRGVPAEIIPVKKYPYKLNTKKLNFLYKKLYDINYPQLAADVLFLSIKNNTVFFKYIMTYPEIKIYNYQKNISRIYLKSIMENTNINYLTRYIKEYGIKIYKLFFLKTVFPGKDKRFIALSLDSKLSNIPFELAFDGDEFLFEKHIVSRIFEDICFSDKIYSEKKDISICIPEYNEKNYFGDELKTDILKEIDNIRVYKKNFTRSGFIKIFANSKVFYFSGHAVYNKKSKEFMFRISNNEYISLTELSNMPEPPELVIFNSCFEYEYYNRAENVIKKFFSNGVLNLIMPFIEVPQKQNAFFSKLFFFLNKKFSIGEAFKLSAARSKIEDNIMIFLRLYGNPINKFF